MPYPLTIVVCTYNREALLRVCLESLANQTLSSDNYEVLVVNNASTDTTAEVVRGFEDRFSHFRCVFEPSQGLSLARNCGWKKAQGRFVAYLDDDARADPRWCEVIVDAIETKLSVAALGGPIFPIFEREPPEWFDPRLEVREWGTEAGFLQSPEARLGFSGSNMVIRRDILEEFGGFASHLGMSGEAIGLGEETELFMRIHPSHSGFWYEPQMRVFHWTPAVKCQPKYRLQRAFNAGKAQALISASHKSPDLFFMRKLATAPYRFGCNTAKRIEMADDPILIGVVAAEEIAHRLGLLTQAFGQTRVGRTISRR